MCLSLENGGTHDRDGRVGAALVEKKCAAAGRF